MNKSAWDKLEGISIWTRITSVAGQLLESSFDIFFLVYKDLGFFDNPFVQFLNVIATKRDLKSALDVTQPMFLTPRS